MSQQAKKRDQDTKIFSVFICWSILAPVRGPFNDRLTKRHHPVPVGLTNHKLESCGSIDVPTGDDLGWAVCFYCNLVRTYTVFPR